MAFDTKKFMKDKFVDRTAEVEVRELKDWFDEGEKPVFIVRGLTGEESAMANEAASNNEKMVAVLAALSSGKSEEITDAVKEMVGLNRKDTPADIIKRKTLLVFGAVEPKVSEEMAVKMAQTFPTVFYSLTTKILQLTGLGQEVGKPKASGDKQESKKA